MKQKLLKTMLLLCALIVGGVSSVWAEDVIDELTASDLAATGNTYTDFSGVSKISDAVYAGQSAKDGSGNIQLRSKNSNSGIVSTTSGGTVKSVTITVGSGSNTIEVYGSNTAYTSASDLYGSNSGTKVGSTSSTGTITFEDDYQYVGIRSNNGAIYLSKIEIVWETSGGDVPTVESVTVSGIPTKAIYKAGEFFDPTGLTVTAHYDDDTSSDVSVGDATWEPGPSTALIAGTTQVTATYMGVTSAPYTCITVNPVYTVTYAANGGTGTMTDANTYVLGEEVTLLSNTFTAPSGKAWDSWQVKDGSDNTVSVSNGKFIMPASNVTVTAQWRDVQTYTAHFSVNGTVDNNDDCTVAEGAAISFPANPAAISGKSFIGWATATISGTTNTAPTFVTSATMGNSDVTYYAVFADMTSSIPAGWTETALGSLTSSDIFVIVGNNGSNYAMTNANGTSNAPNASSVTIADSKITSEVTDDIKWNISGNSTDGYTFYPNGSTETWLYCNTTASTSNNNNIRVGTGTRKVWGVDSNGYLKTKDTYTARYLSIYNDLDFRGYVNTSNGAFVPKFYKYTAGSTTYANYCTTVVPTHTLTYSATNGSIAGVDAGSADVASGASVGEGATVTLTATPEEDYEFVSWSVEGSGSTLSSTTTNPTTFTMGTANATVTATFNYTRVANTINAIADQEVGVLKTITLTPTSSNGTTPFTFSTTSDKISLSTASGTSCTVTGLAVTGESDAVLVIGQAAGTHNDVKYLAAENINVNISVVDNRTTPGITFSSDEINLNAGNDQTVIVTTTHTGTRSVTSSDDDIASVEMSNGNVYVLAGDEGGTATITLSIAENGDYKATSKTFTVNVDDGLSDPTITIDSEEIGINAFKEFTLSSNSAGAITISTDNDHAVLEDNGDGSFNLTSDAVGTVVVNVSQAANGSYRAYETTFDISVVDNRTTPTFSFSDASKTVDWADRGDYVKPTLTSTSDATVVYSSSNTAVATVASNGDITFVAGGTTTITASVSGSASYKDAEASYTLTVNKPFEFADDFAGATISNNTALSTTVHSGWTVSTAYTDNSEGVNGSTCIRLASGSYGGSITTPALTDLPTNSKMTFQAKSYGSDTDVSLSISGTNCTITSPSPASFNITSSYATYTVYITKTGNNPTITISAPLAKKRAYIDNVSITDLPNATISISNVELRAGETANASITTNNETGAFTFVSSDEDVATVAKDGDDYVVTGVAEGTATITATQAGNTYYKTTSTTFTVNVISATAVMNPTLDVASGATVEVGDYITIDAEDGCTIKYTIDNTNPKESGTAISVDTNTASVTVPTGVNSLTLKAVAKNGENFSEVVTATYTVVKKTLNASFASDAIEVAIGGDVVEPALTNPSGGTVTWTSSDTEVVTVDEDGQLTAIAEGTATITASIATTDTYLAGSATYEVTVYDPAKIVVDFNNDPFEIGNTFAQDASLSYTYKGVTFDFAKGEGGTNPRVDGNVSEKVARLYTNNTLFVTAPSGYAISKIVFDFNKGSVTIGSTTYSSSKTTWEGLQTPVQITGSETTFINKMTITLVEIETVTVGSAGYATYASDHALDFTNSSIKAYIAEPNGTTGVRFTQVNKIPAGTGVLLYADGGATEGIPVTTESTDYVASNVFVRGTGAGVASENQGTVNDETHTFHNYILNNVGGVIGFYRANNKIVATNRAYIRIDMNIWGSSVKEFISLPGFDDDPDGIENIEHGTFNIENSIYDLSGRKINGMVNGQLPKGIYIVNGKKILK